MVRNILNGLVMIALIIVVVLTTAAGFGAETKIPVRLASTAPVARQMVVVPKPQLAWYSPYSAVLSKSDCSTMAALYARKDVSKDIDGTTAKDLTTVLCLLSTDVGYADLELHQLLYAITFRGGIKHPLRGLLEKKVKFKIEEFSDDSDEGKAFMEKVNSAAERYGIE